MTSKKVTLQYGCPSCKGIRMNTFFQSLLWRLGIQKSLKKSTLESIPFKQRAYKPITITLDKSRALPFKCPQCSSQGYYQLQKWKKIEYIDWSVELFDNSYLYGKINHCYNCGIMFAVYVKNLKNSGEAICRACNNHWRADSLEDTVKVTNYYFQRT